MAIKDAGEMAETEAGDDCLSLLQKLEHKEILEILSDGLFCQHCEGLLQSRIQNILFNRKVNGSNESAVSLSSSKDSSKCSTTMSHQEQNSPWSSVRTPDSVYSGRQKSYAAANMSPASVNGKHNFLNSMGLVVDRGISEEDDRIRFSQVGRKKDFVYMERVNGRQMNVLQGLELHTQVFNAEEQKRIVECVYNFQRMGQEGRLRARTYSEPRKWMRGKGRVTIQFGCCYNYAVDKNGNPPGIMREEEVDPLPPLFKRMIKRMVRWQVLPATCVPNSCIVNIYDEGDCIPPHIDHHDFLRPFCTVSFLTECNILFGSNLKIVDAGEFSGPVSLSLPVGSVLILSGNGSDKAKHCVPAVPGKRISITFRKMDERKLPHSFLPDPELLGIKPLAYLSASRLPVQQSPRQENQHQNGSHSHDRSGQPLAYSASRSPVQQSPRQERQHQNGSLVQQSQRQEKQNQNGGLSHDRSGVVGEIGSKSNSFVVEKNDFPPLGSSNSGNRKRAGSGWLKK